VAIAGIPEDLVNMNAFSRTIGTALLALLATVGPASAATLDISGPTGARLWVDGAELGTLPLSEPVEVDMGTHTLELRLGGFENHVEDVRVASDDANMVLNLSMLPLQRWRAAAYSALFGGLGQHYEGHSFRGWTMMGLQVAAAAVAAYGESKFQSGRDDFEILDRKYDSAVAPSEIASLREQRDAAYEDMGSAENIRNMALAGVIAVGLWSVVDAWLGFENITIEVAPVPAVSSSGPISLDSVRVGWRLSF
jgi:PEGA domain